jgi:hypothetical protein
LDYEQGLDSWLASGACRRVVFCENSGYDLASLEALAARYAGAEVEFISFRGNESGANKGKGHAELGVLGHALATSRLLADCDVVLKCTGRLIVRNASKLLPPLAAAEALQLRR